MPNLLSWYQNLLIQTKFQYLNLAFDNSNDSKVKPNWLEWCQKAINDLYKAGIDFVKHLKTVTAWNIAFWERDHFPYREKVDRLPLFLHRDEYLVHFFKRYETRKLSEVYSELFYSLGNCAKWFLGPVLLQWGLRFGREDQPDGEEIQDTPMRSWLWFEVLYCHYCT